MKFNKWLLFLLPIIAILAYFSIPTTKPVEETGSDVLKIRKDKDAAFKEGEESPLKDKASFKGLNYYSFNKDYIVDFALEKAEKAETVDIKMTDGTTEKLILFGKIKGELQSFTIALTIYQRENGDFFLPFKDKTAPTETYGGGRYVDISLNKLKDKTILVDFNQAYFPYCAYNPTFTCPVPPKGNDIPTRIPAGERNF
jgi:uncharacterized protein (DUF1684 family)